MGQFCKELIEVAKEPNIPSQIPGNPTQDSWYNNIGKDLPNAFNYPYFAGSLTAIFVGIPTIQLLSDKHFNEKPDKKAMDYFLEVSPKDVAINIAFSLVATHTCQVANYALYNNFGITISCYANFQDPAKFTFLEGFLQGIALEFITLSARLEYESDHRV